jgi:hypothetical protein
VSREKGKSDKKTNLVTESGESSRDTVTNGSVGVTLGDFPTKREKERISDIETKTCRERETHLLASFEEAEVYS